MVFDVDGSEEAGLADFGQHGFANPIGKVFGFGFGFFIAKDIKMAEDCDYGLMVWDIKSTGTLSNAIELLAKKKVSLVYINKAKQFLEVKEISDLEKLISYMSDSAKIKAEEKLGLKNKIESFKNQQTSLF